MASMMVKTDKHGGGQLIAKPAPGAIRLVEKKDAMETGHVHVDYIFDSVELNCLQPLEKYQVKTQKDQTKPCGISIGRNHFSCEEDQAIIDYVKKYGTETGAGSIKGNYLWRKMEKEKVTIHTWQSMRSRFLNHLINTGPKFSFNHLTVATHKGKEIPFAQPPCQSDPKSSQNITRNSATYNVSDTGTEMKNMMKQSSLQMKAEERLKNIQTGKQSTTRKRKINPEHSVEHDICQKTKVVESSKTEDLIIDKNKGNQVSRRQEYMTPSKRSERSCIEKFQIKNGIIDDGNIVRNLQKEHLKSPRNLVKKDLFQPSNIKISDTNKKILKFIQTGEGNNILKVLKLETIIKLFMMRYRLTFLEIFRSMFFANGSLDDADNAISMGTMRNGALPWNYKDDQVLMLKESDENQLQIEDLIKKRGIEEVKKRLKFLE